MSRRKKKDNPEETLQVSVANYLRVAVPDDIPWTAVESSNRGPIDGARQKLKGVKPGWMDIQFLLMPFATYLGIELKSKTGSPSPAQKVVGEAIVAAGGFWFPAKTLGDVEYILRSFGVPLRSRSMERPRPHLVKLVEAVDRSRFLRAA